MKQTKTSIFFQSLAIALVINAGIFLLGTLAIDALEFEQTGKCADCILLNKIRDL